MANFTNCGYLGAMTLEERKAELVEQLVRADGNILLASHNMGYTRWWIYVAIKEHRLWPLVNRLRADRLERQAWERRHGVPSQRATDGEG